MTEPFTSQSLAHPAPEPVFGLSRDERLTPAVIYGLFLIAPFNGGLSALVGLGLALHFRKSASPLQASHYLFQIRTVAFMIGAVLALGISAGLAFPLFLIALGVLFWVFGGIIMLVVGSWFLIRSLVGLVRILQGEAYPQPRSYFL